MGVGLQDAGRDPSPQPRNPAVPGNGKRAWKGSLCLKGFGAEGRREFFLGPSPPARSLDTGPLACCGPPRILPGSHRLRLCLPLPGRSPPP